MRQAVLAINWDCRPFVGGVILQRNNEKWE